MPSIQYNLSLLDRMLEEFEAYILSSVIYWPLSPKGKELSRPPRLTIGGLYLTLDKLASQESEMRRNEVSHYDKLRRILERLSTKWQVGIEQKALQELNSRLNLWKAFMQDLEEDPNRIEAYPHEVRIRVMISHLIDLCEPNQDIKEIKIILKNLDQRIEYFVQADDFLWDDRLREVYPQEKFPYLYRTPRQSRLR
jgi:hypothetical protein